MKRGQVLKTLLKHIGPESGVVIMIEDQPIPIETAVKIWEKLDEDRQDCSVGEPEPKEEPKPKQTATKKPLDDGKILALRNAGWTLEKIADEMNCSVQTVANHLERMKKKTKS